jgi:hypothetical protein
MKETDDISLVSLRFEIDGHPILRMKREGVGRRGGTVANNRVAVCCDDPVCLSAEHDSARFVGKPLTASGQKIIFQRLIKINRNCVSHGELHPLYPSMGDNGKVNNTYRTSFSGLIMKNTMPNAIKDNMDTVMNTVRFEIPINHPNNGGPNATPKNLRLL